MELEAEDLTHMGGLCRWQRCPAAPGSELAQLSWLVVPGLAFHYWDFSVREAQVAPPALCLQEG